ncbi:MAG: hypothetical protein U9P90_01130, partial [Patescibacteria group bacterium]|nr:hypothetical protein [Patescibacteria group bacterium]
LSIGSEPALNKAKDSYNPHIKKLAKNYQFFPPRRIYLEKRELEYNQIEINNLIKRGFEYVMRTDKPNGGKGQIYKLLKNGLKELTEQDKITEAYREFARRKDLTGISENNYYKLLK